MLIDERVESLPSRDLEPARKNDHNPKSEPILHAADMRLFSITAIVEAEDEKDVEAVQAAIQQAICPYPGDADHRCPRGWMTMTHELDEDEAAIWREPDTLNR